MIETRSSKTTKMGSVPKKKNNCTYDILRVHTPNTKNVRENEMMEK